MFKVFFTTKIGNSFQGAAFDSLEEARVEAERLIKNNKEWVYFEDYWLRISEIAEIRIERFSS